MKLQQKTVEPGGAAVLCAGGDDRIAGRGGMHIAVGGDGHGGGIAAAPCESGERGVLRLQIGLHEEALAHAQRGLMGGQIDRGDPLCLLLLYIGRFGNDLKRIIYLSSLLNLICLILQI